MTRLSEIANGRRGEDGLTLVELLITMLLLGIVSALVLSGVLLVNRAVRNVTNDTTGGDAVQTATERMSRDLRQAGKISSATSSSVTFWVDSNDNYKQDTGEAITWSTSTVAGKPTLCRTTDNGTSSCVTEPAGSTTTFSYDSSTLANIRVVTVTLSTPGAAAGATHPQQWVVSLRNVG